MTWENASGRRLSRSVLAARAASRPAGSQICDIASRKRGSGAISAPPPRGPAPPVRLAPCAPSRVPRFSAPCALPRPGSAPPRPGFARPAPASWLLAPRAPAPVSDPVAPRLTPPSPGPLPPASRLPCAPPRPGSCVSCAPPSTPPTFAATFSRRNGTNRQFGTVGSATVGRFGGRRPHVLGVFPGRLRTARRPWRRAPYQTAD